jgi:hypothetical protein
MATTYTISDYQLDELVGASGCTGNSECQKIKDTHLANQKRLIKLNSYYGKKHSAQTKILQSIYIMVILVVAIYAVRVYFDFFPDWMLTAAMSLVIGSFTIYILFQCVDITNRNNMDYDLYDTHLTNLPKLASEPGTIESGVGAGGIMSSSKSAQLTYSSGGKGCHNQQCCPTFFTFNPTLGYCSINPFT